mgnify:CR=1 FL=1
MIPQGGGKVVSVTHHKGGHIPVKHTHASNQFMYCIEGEYEYLEPKPGLVLKAGVWYLVALSGRARAVRTFRVSRVQSVRVLSAQVHPDLAGAAMDAVRQWRYSPTLLNGVAVEVMMTVNVTFDLAR